MGKRQTCEMPEAKRAVNTIGKPINNPKILQKGETQDV
jgi:hypothetical protein